MHTPRASSAAAAKQSKETRCSCGLHLGEGLENKDQNGNPLFLGNGRTGNQGQFKFKQDYRTSVRSYSQIERRARQPVEERAKRKGGKGKTLLYLQDEVVRTMMEGQRRKKFQYAKRMRKGIRMVDSFTQELHDSLGFFPP